MFVAALNFLMKCRCTMFEVWLGHSATQTTLICAQHKPKVWKQPLNFSKTKYKSIQPTLRSMIMISSSTKEVLVMLYVKVSNIIFWK